MATPPLPSRTRTPTRRTSPGASAASDWSAASDNDRKSPNGRGAGVGAGGGGGNGGDRANSAVRVVVRVRPQNKREIEAGGTICVSFPSEETIELNESKKTYDRVFDPFTTQKQVFDYVAKPLVNDLFDGYNGTIFAYGQTSSGKTHTMEGPSIHDPELAGVIPRTVREIFFAVAEAPDSVEFVIKVSYIEIYMEKIRDLLDSYHTKMNLAIREDKQRGVYVAGATEEYVTSADELMAVMSEGAKNRVTAATGMNQGSSRSHSVFIITVQQRDVNDSSTKTGLLYLVDLAGSEMVKKTHASGQVLNEAKMINKSLSALGQVINALTDDKKPHVPYRDSRLTRVLQNSLGGNSKTCLIVNCSPSSFNAAETLSTLRFGSRAKRIQNKAIVNETRSVEELGALLSKAESTIDMLQTYIAALEKQVEAYKSASVQPPRPPTSEAGGVGGGDGGDGAVTEVRPPRDEEAADAIRCLTKRNQALQAEVEEEKAEVKRCEQVSSGLRQVLQEKENHLMEAASLLRQAESENSRDREAFLLEKADLEAELEALRAHVEEIIQRHNFEIEEQCLTLDKLSGENARLAEELREITGDDLPEVTSSSSPAQKATTSTSTSPRGGGGGGGGTPLSTTSSPGQTASLSSGGAGTATSGGSAAGSDVPSYDASAAGDGEAGSPELTGDMASSASAGTVRVPLASRGASAAVTDSDGVFLEEASAGTVAAEEMDPLDRAALESAGASEAAIALVLEREDHWRERDAKLIAEQWRYMQRAQQLLEEKELIARQLAAKKQNCEHLQKDLHENVKRREMEMEQDRAAEAHGDATDPELRKNKDRIFEQQGLALAQLTEVHRKLLWKFGKMEQERAALAKRLRSREVEIARLEQELLMVNTKYKTMKDHHAKKLASLRQEVLKMEQEAQRQKQASSSHPYLERRAVRGGGGSHHAQEVKTLRGGNGRRSHDEARPWGGLGFDVKSNTYASELGQVHVESPAGSGAASPQARRRSAGGTPMKAPMETSPGGRTRAEGIIERLLGNRGATPKHYN